MLTVKILKDIYIHGHRVLRAGEYRIQPDQLSADKHIVTLLLAGFEVILIDDDGDFVLI